MDGYLGESRVEPTGTPFDGFGSAEWALHFIGTYGGIDGGHHKMWVLDQVARILNGTPVILSIAKWSNGKQEYRLSTGEPSSGYAAWVGEQRAGCDGPDTYDWGVGIAP